MYWVIVETRFTASHGVRMPDGEREALHSHDWRVRACFRRTELDELDMVVDFGVVQAALADVVSPLANRNLNEHPALAGRNTTAETIARHIFEALVARRLETLDRVEVTEAPGCVAVYGGRDAAAT